MKNRPFAGLQQKLVVVRWPTAVKKNDAIFTTIPPPVGHRIYYIEELENEICATCDNRRYFDVKRRRRASAMLWWRSMKTRTVSLRSTFTTHIRHLTLNVPSDRRTEEGPDRNNEHHSNMPTSSGPGKEDWRGCWWLAPTCHRCISEYTLSCCHLRFCCHLRWRLYYLQSVKYYSLSFEMGTKIVALLFFQHTHNICAWTYPGIRKGGVGRIIISLANSNIYNNHHHVKNMMKYM